MFLIYQSIGNDAFLDLTSHLSNAWLKNTAKRPQLFRQGLPNKKFQFRFDVFPHFIAALITLRAMPFTVLLIGVLFI